MENENVLFLLYEDLKEDLAREVVKVATFLGGSYAEDLKKDGGKLLAHVVEKSSFSSMNSMGNSKWVSRGTSGVFIRE